jgi:hypothetical protein
MQIPTILQYIEQKKLSKLECWLKNGFWYWSVGLARNYKRTAVSNISRLSLLKWACVWNRPSVHIAALKYSRSFSTHLHPHLYTGVYGHRWASTLISMSAISDIRHRHLLFRYRRQICRTEKRHSDIGSVLISTSEFIPISDIEEKKKFLPADLNPGPLKWQASALILSNCNYLFW